MLKIGERIEIIDYSDDDYLGEDGEIIRISDGIKVKSQPIAEWQEFPKLESEPRFSVRLNNGKELHCLREQQLRKLREDDNILDFDNLIAHLSGARIGQNNNSRAYHVSETLVPYLIYTQQATVKTQRKLDLMISESAHVLLEEYEKYLRQGNRTKEAARKAIKGEYMRLIKKCADLK